MQALVEASPPLDNNSRYCYLLLCEHFAATCAVAECDGRVQAFMTAYIPPTRPDTLFVWQVAVSLPLRGQGVARRLLEHILQRGHLSDARFVEATVNPSNDASRGLFAALARTCGAPMSETCIFPEALFPAGHEQENLLRIGPIQFQYR